MTPNEVRDAILADKLVSAQDVYDAVCLHLATQKRRSMRRAPDGSWGLCAYRGLDGNECAVGAVIPDELYKPALDQLSPNSVEDLLQRQAFGIRDKRLISFLTEHEGLLEALQAAHDAEGEDDVTLLCPTVAYDLRRIGKENGLSTAALEGLSFHPS